MSELERRPAERFVKGAIDRVGAAIGLLLLLPVLALVALVVRVAAGSPVIFRQTRPGFRGRPFELLKFRTMQAGAATDGERLTGLGRLLRSTSLDELPQLWNVLRGDMSLVGPRPLLMHYLDLYTPDEARRHEMKPGVTGLAQVKGRNLLGWEPRLAMDVWYVDHWSLGLDLRILAMTVGAVLTRRGISAPGSATMTELRRGPKGRRHATPGGLL